MSQCHLSKNTALVQLQFSYIVIALKFDEKEQLVCRAIKWIKFTPIGWKGKVGVGIEGSIEVLQGGALRM